VRQKGLRLLEAVRDGGVELTIEVGEDDIRGVPYQQAL
jgi:hypothetical protein